jgi:hypothetical protein
MFSENRIDDTENIKYLNPWGKKLIKILLVPGSKEQLVCIFEEGDDVKSYNFALASIADLLMGFGDLEIDDDDDYDDDNAGDYSYDDDNKDSDFCEACQESPCMCSDREKSSTTYDY